MVAEMGKRKIKTGDAPGLGVPAFFAYPGYGMVQLNAFKGTSSRDAAADGVHQT